MRELRTPWIGLVAALAAHVADEAATGFLDFYNPLVQSIRTSVPFFPMPTLTFDVWVTGLVALVIVLAAITPWIARGGGGARAVSWLLSAIMVLNALGHLIGSVYFQRWLPGTTSAPFLLVADVNELRTVAKPDGSSVLSAVRIKGEDVAHR